VIERLSEQVGELRGEVKATRRLLLETSACALDLVPIDLLAGLLQRSPKTILRDARSSDPVQRIRWPELWHNGSGSWWTTPASIRLWQQRGKSSYFGTEEVRQALERAAAKLAGEDARGRHLRGRRR